MGDERAETYLRVLAEAELRRVSSRLRLLDAAAGTDVWSPPDSSLFVTAERAQWKVGRTGRILLAAGVLDPEALFGATGHFFDAIQVRSWLTDGGGNWHVGTAVEPWTFGDGIQAFRLRLTPPLTSVPDAAELVLTGPFTRVRVRFP